jgi:sugar phosphate isomerase/epimerase
MSAPDLRWGYGTNGFTNHRLSDALVVLADLGYTGVALTLDYCHLDPYSAGLARRTAAVGAQLSRLGLSVVIETGARYLLDPRHKHAPTLLDGQDGRQRRLDLLLRAVEIAADLGAEAVSCWSGVRPPTVNHRVAWQRLVAACATLVAHADRRAVPLGFEPEPGMLIGTVKQWTRLRQELGRPSGFGLTLDIGHCRCVEADPVPACVTNAAPHLVNVQIDDMRRGVHEHLEFGQGEIDFTSVLAALRQAGYRGLVTVELPRHSHAAPRVAARALTFLHAAEQHAAAREVLV